MMSLQVLFLVLVLITLVISLICKLQKTRRKKEEVEEVKPLSDSVEYFCFCGEVKDPDFGDGTRCTKCILTYTGYLAMRKIISSLEGTHPEINWDEYEEEEEDYNSCYLCDGMSYLGVACQNCCIKNEENVNVSSDTDTDTCNDCISLGRECVSCVTYALYEEEEKEEEDNILDDMYIIQEKLNKNRMKRTKFKRKKTKYKRRQIRKLSFRELHIKTFG